MEEETQVAPKQKIRIKMFGEKLRLFVGEVEVNLWSNDADLLALLVLKEGKAARKFLIESLRSSKERLEKDCAGLLKQSLSRLRAVLGSDRLPAYTRGNVFLTLKNASIDTLDFKRWAGSKEIDELREAVKLYGKGLLLDCYDEWAIEKQKEAEAQYIAAVVQSAEYELRAGNLRDASQYAETALNTIVFGDEEGALEDLQDKIKQWQRRAFTSPYYGIRESIPDLEQQLKPRVSSSVPITASEINHYAGRLAIVAPPAEVLMSVSHELAKNNADTEEDRLQALRLVLNRLPEYHPLAEVHESVRQWVDALNKPVDDAAKMADALEYANFIKAVFSDVSAKALYTPTYNSKQIRKWRIFVELFPDAAMRVLKQIIKRSADVQKLVASFGLIAAIANIDDDGFNGTIIDMFDLFEERLGSGKNHAFDGDEYMLRRQYLYSRAEASHAEEDIKAIIDFRRHRLEQDFTLDRLYYSCTTDDMLADVTEGKLLRPTKRHLAMREFNITTLENLLGNRSLLSPEYRERLEKITL